MTVRKDWLSGIDVNLLIFSLTPTVQHPTVKKTHLNVHCKKIIIPYGVKKGDRSVKRVKSYSKWSVIYSKLLNFE